MESLNFISTGSGSHIAIALNKVATGYKTIMINYGGMSDIVQGKEFSRYAFRVCQNSYNFTSALAQLMASKPYRRFYIICQDYSYGHSVANHFKAALKKYRPDAKIVGGANYARLADGALFIRIEGPHEQGVLHVRPR